MQYHVTAFNKQTTPNTASNSICFTYLMTVRLTTNDCLTMAGFTSVVGQDHFCKV